MITVEITMEDIRQGKRRSPCDCPIALGFARKYPGSRPSINADGAEFTLNGARHDLIITDAAIEFMDAFDTEPKDRGNSYLSIVRPRELVLCSDP